MLGRSENPGIMPRTIDDLFEELGRRSTLKASVRLSYVEVYNEQLHDLLDCTADKSLQVLEDPVKGVLISNVSQHVAQSTSHVLELLSAGNLNRTEAPTAANPTSSRSHAICIVVVETKPAIEDVRYNVTTSKLCLVDLAGSERAISNDNRGRRLIEGASINKSLLALANCINALAACKSGTFVPFRDSKLTRLLKDSLGGTSRTCMIACINSSSSNWEESLNTLKYADRAKSIKVQAVKNERQVRHHVQEYEKLISDLRTEIASLKQQVSEVSSVPSSLGPQSQENLEMFSTLWEEITQNFRSRLDERKVIVELQATNMDNARKREAQEAALARLTSRGRSASAGETRASAQQDIEQVPGWLRDQVEELQASIDAVTTSMAENEATLHQHHELLTKFEEKHKALETQLLPENGVPSIERKLLLDMLSHQQELEVSNIELELQVRLRDKQLLGMVSQDPDELFSSRTPQASSHGRPLQKARTSSCPEIITIALSDDKKKKKHSRVCVLL